MYSSFNNAIGMSNLSSVLISQHVSEAHTNSTFNNIHPDRVIDQGFVVGMGLTLTRDFGVHSRSSL
jgi:hypothetical protein